MAPSRRPTLRLERSLLSQGLPVVIGIDEVGRGALAGPITVGAVAVDAACRSTPTGVRDSKLLSRRQREQLAPAIRRWAAAVAVGQCSAEEIDAFGVIGALRTAALRALLALPYDTLPMVLLDGSHRFIEPGENVVDGQSVTIEQSRCTPRADNTWSTVAAASIVAKVARDSQMVGFSGRYGAYQWHHNMGYATPEHIRALRVVGPCRQHRLSWRLPTNDPEDHDEVSAGSYHGQSQRGSGGRGQHMARRTQ